MPNFDIANHRHKWGATETQAQRANRLRLQAEYAARRKQIDDAAAAAYGRSVEAKRDAEFVREQRQKA